MKKLLIVLFISPIFLALHCGKNPDVYISPLPPYTEEGKNTFGCYVNGNAWEPRVSWGYMLGSGKDPLITSYDLEKEYFQIIARQYGTEERSSSIVIHLKEGVSGTGIYNLNHDSASRSVYYSSETDGFFYAEAGNLEIKFIDMERNIISGTFNFTAVNPETGHTAEINSGRFDTFYY